MPIRTFSWVFIAMVIFMQGCETAKGAKKHIENTWHNVADESGAIQKADKWLQENAW